MVTGLCPPSCRWSEATRARASLLQGVIWSQTLRLEITRVLRYGFPRKQVTMDTFTNISQWLNGSCLACDFCQTGDEPLCGKALLSGYTVDGTFQQYCIAKAAHVARIPKEVPLDAVAPVLCAGITVYKGLKESGARPGQTVAIVGAGGGLGSLACQYAKAMGLQVIGIDTGEEKKKMVTGQLGAKAFVDFATSKNVVKDVQAATEDGTGPHAVILVAVNEKPFQQAAEYVRPRGTVVAIGLPAGAFLKAPVFETVIGMKTIKGSYVGNRKDTTEALDFFKRGLINSPFKTIGMSELQKVYDLMRKLAFFVPTQDGLLMGLQMRARLLDAMLLTQANEAGYAEPKKGDWYCRRIPWGHNYELRTMRRAASSTLGVSFSVLITINQNALRQNVIQSPQLHDRNRIHPR